MRLIAVLCVLLLWGTASASSAHDSLYTAFETATNPSKTIQLGLKWLQSDVSIQDKKYNRVKQKLFRDIKRTKIGKVEFEQILDCVYLLSKKGAKNDAQELVNWSLKHIRGLSVLNYRAQLKLAKALVLINSGEREGMTELLTDALKQMEDNEPRLKSRILMERGRVYYDLSNYNMAMDNYMKALKVLDKHNIRNSDYVDLMHFIGSVFKRQNDEAKAMEYYEKMLQLSRENKNKYQEAEALYLLADLYAFAGDYEKDLDYLTKALAIYRDLEYETGIAQLQLNIAHGEIYSEEFDSAIKRLEEVLDISKRLSINDFDVTVHRYLGRIYAKKGDILRSDKHFNLAIEMAQSSEVKRLLNLSDIHRNIAYVYYDRGNFKSAFDQLELHLVYNDSLIRQKNQEVIHGLEQKYENKKKAARIEVLNKDKKIREKELERKNTTIRAFIIGISLVAVLALTVFYGLINNRRKNKVILAQKELVEERNKEILDSITYAKRIQNAILPPAKLVKAYLADSFILYKPKDIVAGDFYWMEPQEDGVIFAAADCTGHGVPGAMVSVVCNNGLNRSVREFGLREPGAILNKTRELVVQEFEKSDEDVQDGMDVALCYLKRKEEAVEVLFSGANNPLWIIRSGQSHIDEIKPDKQAIGKTANPKEFTTHAVTLNKGDAIYIFTDGFADQFGGENNKKMLKKQFKEILLQISSRTMQEQRDLLNQHFEHWKGGNEQIDDVCVIGVQV
jgi:serine phosphatase RsbU (regulator of sigma subunit)/lipopolysaccharide biosynthesis regulator YciM